MEKHAVYAFPLFDENHNVTQIIHYCIDITERKQLEAIAEAANLMENLGYFFSGIRHEIGNPVNSVKMALSVLSMNLDLYSKTVIQEFLQRVMGEVSRMEYLLKALKNFSMYETLNIESVMLAPLITNFVHLVEKDFEAKGIRIKVKMPDMPLAVMTDEQAFHQGTGLGLVIVKKMLSKMNSHIRLHVHSR